MVEKGRIRKLSLLVLFLGINVLIFGNGNSYKFNKYSVNEGLSQSTVFSIIQDSKGFIWLGTRTGGLNRFDGYSFKNYKRNPNDPYAISGNEIICLFEDSQGFIWAGTRNDGLNRFDPNTGLFENFFTETDNNQTIQDNTINSIFEDQNRNIWIATNRGVSIYDVGQNRFKRIKNSITQESFGQVTNLSENPDGSINIGTRNEGVYILNSVNFLVTDNIRHIDSDTLSISSDNITATLLDRNGRMWLGTRNHGLNRSLNNATNKFYRISHSTSNPDGISSDIIRTLWEDKQGNIWVGTKDGLDLILPEYQDWPTPKVIHFKNEEDNLNSLSQNSIYSFCEDKEGDIWVGTWSGGVNHISQEGYKFSHFSRQPSDDQSLNNNVISSFIEFDDQLWIGTEGGGINILNSYTGKFDHLESDPTDTSSLRSNHIKSFLVDTDGELWVGTFDGLHLYNKYTGKFSHFLKGASIYAIESGRRNEIWIGTSRYLYKLNKENGELKTYISSGSDEQSLTNNAINVLFRDSNNNLWIGTKRGLNCYQPDSDSFVRYWHTRESREGLSNNFITTITENESGNIVVGTYDGLNILKKDLETFHHVGELNGLPDNVINNIICHKNDIWASTNRGLSRITYSTDTNGDIEIEEIRNYDKEDGLQGNEFTMNAAYKSKKHIFFGGLNGFNRFDPDDIKVNQNIPAVQLTSFKLYNEEVKIGAKGSPLTMHISNTKNVTLNYKQSVFTIGFVALNYHVPEKNQYAYMLDGFDEDWIYAGNKREVTYTNLPAGKYEFKIKASNNDGIWNEQGSSLKIHIKPPWWKTIAFYLITTVVLIMLVVTIVKGREKQIKKDRERLETELAEGKQKIEEQRVFVENQAKELQERQESEKLMKWHNKGVIRFSKLISEERSDMNRLASSLIVDLVQYLEVQMGAIYFVKEVEDKEQLELMGGYALDESHVDSNTVNVGEGLVGTCYRNKEVLRFDDLPLNYAELGSGLGNIELSHLLLIPILYEGKGEGVIELISLEEVSEYKIKLIESISQTLGAALINERSNLKIQHMLSDSISQKEQMAAQEEEMRQNLEELKATQEQSTRREQSLLEEISRLKSKVMS